jgi:hypothetical protein
METYNYKILCEKDYAQSGTPELDVTRLQVDLDRFGAEGYRFIETIYNSDGTWIVLLSCPDNYGVNKEKIGHSNLSGRYSNRKPPYRQLNTRE